MPRITDDQIDEEYFKKYLLTAIMPNGDIIAIERELNKNQDWVHQQAFKALVDEIKRIKGACFTLVSKDHVEENFDEFCKNGIIPISPYYISHSPYYIKSDMQMLMFPQNCRKCQLEKVRKMLISFEQVGMVYFNGYGNSSDKEQEGVDNLRKYIEEKIHLIEMEEQGLEEYNL